MGKNMGKRDMISVNQTKQLNIFIPKIKNIKFLGKYADVAANEADTIVEIKTYTADIVGDPIPSNEIAEQRWFSISDDPNILSAITKNRILPVLLDKGLI